MESLGVEKIEPFVENESSAAIFYKPEEPEHNGPNGTASGPNPGKDVDGAYPIAPKTDLYAPVDGIKTTATPAGEVCKIPSKGTATVATDGKVSQSAFGVVGSFIGLAGNMKPPDSNWTKLANSNP